MSGAGRTAKLLGLLASAALGCGHGDGQPAPADSGLTPRAQLLDPTLCGSCHKDHYDDWVTSMHAYAADDPVFLAMNARGQRETDGGLGTFCVNCHAPMAVHDGMTKDGLNLASLPARYRGVTCFFCHSVSGVGGSHNAEVTVSDDLVMRGEYGDPVPNGVHASGYSPLHDYNQADSAKMCGACHDIVTPSGTELERTFAEWKASPYSGPMGLTCATSSCHMAEKTNTPIAQRPPGVPSRTFRHHDFPAVDVALTGDAGAGPTVAVQQKLANSVLGALCVTSPPSGGGGIRVVLDAFALGHNFPSGAGQDRRLWIEINAYRGAETTPYYSSGHVEAGASPVDIQSDPDRWVMRDCIFGADGGEVSMFWQASGPTDNNALPPLGAFLPDPPPYGSHVEQFFPRDGTPLATRPDRVTLNVWLQPVGVDVLSDLVASHDLDPSFVAAMPTFAVPFGYQADGTPQEQLVWTGAAAADAGITAPTDAYDNSNVTCVGTLRNTAPVPTKRHMRCAP